MDDITRYLQIQDEDHKEVIMLWREGWSVREISEETGYSTTEVANILTAANEYY